MSRLATISSRGPRRAALPAILLLALSIAACGNAGMEHEGKEGEFVTAGPGIVYQVQLSRLLTPSQRPDDNLLEGQPPLEAGEQYFGVFMIVQNKSDKPYTPPANMRVVDTQGNEYEPLNATRSGFGLSFEDPIPPGGSAPPVDSPAASGPDAASMVLFRLSEQSVTENIPVELEIPVAGEKPSRIELDI